MRSCRRTVALALAFVTVTIASGCASTPTPPPRPTLGVAALDGVRRVAVVQTGESRFVVLEQSKDNARVIDDVLKWFPKGWFIPIARAVYLGVTSLIDAERASSTLPKDVTPGEVVAEALTRTLRVSGPFNELVLLKREPVGDDRKQTDAVIRLSVPSWGLMRIRDGSAAQVASFADVRAELVLRETGVVLWQLEEDVTHPQRRSPDALKADRALTRQELLDVLEHAGRRLANELVYASGAGR